MDLLLLGICMFPFFLKAYKASDPENKDLSVVIGSIVACGLIYGSRQFLFMVMGV